MLCGGGDVPVDIVFVSFSFLLSLGVFVTLLASLLLSWSKEEPVIVEEETLFLFFTCFSDFDCVVPTDFVL